MSSPCEQLRQEYEELKTLNQEFVLAYKKALETGDLKKAKQLKAELEERRNALENKLWPFDKKELSREEFERQYNSQKETMKRVGILKELRTGEWGIIGIDNEEYVFPSLREITERMRKNKEALKPKTEQGFNRFLITPIGMRLDDLIEIYKQVILKHHREGKLFATKKNPSDPDEPLEFNEEEPVWVLDKYQNADISGELVYFPQEFSQDHQGKTKQEILKDQGGFTVMLTEDLPNIPRQGKGKEIGGRKQLEANQTPNKYLEILKTDPAHQNETGMTPEEQIILAILRLEETNQVLDDYSGNGSASHQLGAYFTDDGYVPSACWYRGGRQAYLGRGDPENSYSAFGVRAGVRVKKLKA